MYTTRRPSSLERGVGVSEPYQSFVFHRVVRAVERVDVAMSERRMFF
jgi:hypothetical protein